MGGSCVLRLAFFTLEAEEEKPLIFCFAGRQEARPEMRPHQSRRRVRLQLRPPAGLALYVARRVVTRFQ